MRNITILPKITIVLFGIALLLSITHVLLILVIENFDASIKDGVLALFNVNAEVSIPTWFAQSLLLIASGLLLVIGLSRNSFRFHWFGLAIIFLYISIDEGAAIHELTTIPVRNLLGVTSGVLYYSWIVLFLALLLFISLFYIRFFRALPRTARFLFATAAVLFLSGAVGFEMIGASIASHSGETGHLYAVVVAFEEFLEMTGTIVFIYALLRYLSTEKPRVSLQVKEQKEV